MDVGYKDYYAILGVDRTASAEEIRKTYRKLARQYHPDVNKSSGAESRYVEINEAYEVLKDPEKRAKYDQLGSRWQEGESVNPPPGWEYASQGGGFDFGSSGSFGGGFSDFFNMFFGGMGGFGSAGGSPFYGASGGTRKPPSQEFALEITLREAAEGTTRKLTLDEGNGRQRTLNVRIPPGVAEGSKVRLAGKGASVPGGEPGDLYLRIRLLPDPVFKAEGRDLHTLLKLAPWEACLGAKITVPTLEGDVVMTIPPGTQGGQVFRLKHKGLPRRKGGAGASFRQNRDRYSQTSFLSGKGAYRAACQGNFFQAPGVDVSEMPRRFLLEERKRRAPFFKRSPSLTLVGCRSKALFAYAVLCENGVVGSVGLDLRQSLVEGFDKLLMAGVLETRSHVKLVARKAALGKFDLFQQLRSLLRENVPGHDFIFQSKVDTACHEFLHVRYEISRLLSPEIRSAPEVISVAVAPDNSHGKALQAFEVLVLEGVPLTLDKLDLIFRIGLAEEKVLFAAFRHPHVRENVVISLANAFFRPGPRNEVHGNRISLGSESGSGNFEGKSLLRSVRIGEGRPGIRCGGYIRGGKAGSSEKKNNHKA